MCSYNEQDKQFYSTHQDLVHSVVVCMREKGRRRKGEGGREEGREEGGREGKEEEKRGRGRRWVSTGQ